MVLKNVLLAHPTVWLGVTYKFSFKEDKANYLPVNPIEEQLERMQTAFEDLDANQIQLAMDKKLVGKPHIEYAR